MQWTVVVVCIYFVHLYFTFVFSSPKHRENVFIWCTLPHAFGIGTDASPVHHGPLHSVIYDGLTLSPGVALPNLVISRGSSHPPARSDLTRSVIDLVPHLPLGLDFHLY